MRCFIKLFLEIGQLIGLEIECMSERCVKFWRFLLRKFPQVFFVELRGLLGLG